MLRRYVAEHGYPAAPETAVDHILRMTSDELRRASAEDLSIIAFELGVAAFAVGDEYNRQKSLVERCETVLGHMVGGRLNHAIYGRDDKWLEAVQQNLEAKNYWLKMRNARTVLLRLEGQSLRIHEISKAVANLMFARRV